MGHGLSAQDPPLPPPPGGGGEAPLQLAEVLDVPEIQAMMEDFYRLTRIGIGIIDLQGRILVATGWQDICTRFHRAHPETLRYCIESDTQLSGGVEPGAFKFYKCKNHLWDVVTPIVVKGRHLGNLFLGQFFFADEEPDRQLFRDQARRYGFDEDSYLAALDRVPRWSRETVDTALALYRRLAEVISRLSYGNIELAKAFEEQRRLLATLQEGEEALRIQAAVLEQLTEGVAYTSLDGVIVFANAAFAALHGYEPRELVGKHLSIFHTPDQMPAVEAANAQLMVRGEWNGEIWHRRRDGSVFPAQMHNVVLRDADGTVRGIIGTMFDITERARRDEALRESEAKFRMLFEGASDSIFLMKGERFVDCNSRTLQIFGCTREQIIGEPPYRFSPQRQHDGRDSRELAEERMRAALSGEPQNFEWLHCRYDGTPFDAEISLNRIRLEGEWELQAIVRDITGRKETERRLREALAEKEVLLREVHHRVKNNLQVIVSLLDVESGNVSDPALREAIGAIQARAVTMATIHRHLSASEDLSRVELSAYLETLVEMLQGTLQTGCPVEVRLEAAGVLLPLDSALIVGLIVNELITNAFKYAFPVCREGGCWIAILLKCDEGRCELTVSDNGVGLPEGFDPKQARTQGLRLVGVLARQLKAEVSVVSRPGTTFTICFTAGSA